MSRNRYGRIYHSEFDYINLRFPSVDAQRKFAEKFEAYHASHDHDGDAPRFEIVKATSIGNMEATTVHDAHSVSIDGYATYEIEEYHNRDSWTRRYRYKPPTCCVPPIISINRTFLASDTLERHELSTIFTDMPEEDYTSLLESVKKDGFKDPIIRLLGTEVLDGWHRYRAAKELNLLRKLRFHQWDEKAEGDPAAFVKARNLERRHLSKAQRGQIVVLFNTRAGAGNPNQLHQNGEVKTREELAAEAGVGTSTIDRAFVVEKAGEAEAVISGKKTAGEVLKEREASQQLKRKKKKLTAMWNARVQSTRDYVGDGDTELNQYLMIDELEKGFARHHKNLEDAFKSGMQRIKAAKGFFDDFEERALEDDVSLEDLEKECKAISIYAHDLAHWTDQDWIQEMIASKKEAPVEDSGPLAAKKIVLENMWETLEGVVKYHDGETQLNQHLTVTELEKGFVESNPAYADAFTSGLQRIDAAETFTDFQDHALEVDEFGLAKVDTSELEKEARAFRTFGGDLRNWERPDWSPDTNWILPMIQAKEASQSASSSPSVSDLWDKIERNTAAIRNAYTEVYQKGAISVSEMFTAGITYYNLPKEGLELSLDNPTGGYEDKKRLTRIEGVTARMFLDFTESRVKAGWIRKCLSANVSGSDEPDMDALWVAYNKRYPKWKAKYAASGYKENDLIQASTEAEMLDALRVYRESDRTGLPTADEVIDMTDLMKAQSYPFARCLRDLLRAKLAASESGEETDVDTEKSDALDKFKTQKADLYALIGRTPLISVKDEFGNENADIARHRVMVAAHKAYDVSEDLLWSDPAIETLDAADIRRITGLYYLMAQDLTASRADWVTALYQEIDRDVLSDDQVSPSESESVALNSMEITKIIVFYDDPNTTERPSERHIEFSGNPTAHKSLEDLPFVVRMKLAEEIDLSE